MKALKAFKYTEGKCPERYVCTKCGASECKLWRQYQTLREHIELLCISCAEKDQKKKCELEEGGSDAIGWLVPAVPTEDGETYWGYTSVPISGCDWWDSLPMRAGEKPPFETLSPYMKRRFLLLRQGRDLFKDKLAELIKEVMEKGFESARDRASRMEYLCR